MAGVLRGPGRGLSDSEKSEGLHIANAMLDGVKIERFFFYQVIRTLFDTAYAQETYTIGDQALGADWAVERPEKLLGAGFLVPGGNALMPAEIPMYVVLAFEEYKNIVTKQVQAAYPQVIYYQPVDQSNLSLGTAKIWPVPNQVYKVAIYTPGTVNEFTDINADFIVPRGYREYLEYAGAVAVHNRYPHLPMDPDVRLHAETYKARVKANQMQPNFIRSEGAVLRSGGGGSVVWFNGRTLLPW
jgi:hypothetical protein